VKTTTFCCFALGLLIAGNWASAAEKSAPPASSNSGASQSATTASSELHDLTARIQSRLDQGKNTFADLEEELKGFDPLLARYAGQKTDEVAEILCTQARLYLQVLGDSAKSRQLILQLKREFPLTTQGRKADEILTSISRHEEAVRIRSFLVPGSQFPDFAEKDSTRHQLTLSAYKGKVVLLHFWASWSKPSVAELPTLLALYEKYQGRGFDIIGISLDDDQLKLSAFTTRNQIPWPQFCDRGGWKNKLALKYGVDVIPASYLLDRDGRIIAKNLAGEDLHAHVVAALDQK
jgi:peroxiredoxin